VTSASGGIAHVNFEAIDARFEAALANASRSLTPLNGSWRKAS